MLCCTQLCAPPPLRYLRTMGMSACYVLLVRPN